MEEISEDLRSMQVADSRTYFQKTVTRLLLNWYG